MPHDKNNREIKVGDIVKAHDPNQSDRVFVGAVTQVNVSESCNIVVDQPLVVVESQDRRVVARQPGASYFTAKHAEVVH